MPREHTSRSRHHQPLSPHLGVSCLSVHPHLGWKESQRWCVVCFGIVCRGVVAQVCRSHVRGLGAMRSDKRLPHRGAPSETSVEWHLSLRGQRAFT